MNIDYQLNKASVAFNEIYFDSPHIEIFCGSTFGSLCCIKHRNLNFICFSRFSLILILGDVTVGIRAQHDSRILKWIETIERGEDFDFR